MDRVTCAECQENYDSDAMPFCPRCGSTKSTPGVLSGARATAAARDPRRRRVQIGGVMLTILGGLGVVMFILSAVLAGQLMTDIAGDVLVGLPGGELEVRVLDNGTAVPNATVQILHQNGTILHEDRTEASGWSNVTALDEALVDVRVLTPEGNWTRTVIVLQGSDDQLIIDVAEDPTTSPDWVGAAELVRTLRITAVVFSVASLMVLAAGISALRLRNRGLAITGAVVGLIPALLLFVVTLAVGALLMVLSLTVALYMVVAGRHQFID